jgi:2-keto-3-deoxy-galactonokinase
MINVSKLLNNHTRINNKQYTVRHSHVFHTTHYAKLHNYLVRHPLYIPQHNHIVTCEEVQHIHTHNNVYSANVENAHNNHTRTTNTINIIHYTMHQTTCSVTHTIPKTYNTQKPTHMKNVSELLNNHTRMNNKQYTVRHSHVFHTIHYAKQHNYLIGH